MPLIKDGKEIENNWSFAESVDAIGDAHPVTVSLQDWRDHAETLTQRNVAIGVRLSPADDPHLLQDWLDQIPLIEVDFPKYTDGRGYSQAQLLRRRLGYTGELRAVGHVLRDQILYMHRSGFDAYQTQRADLSSVVEALEEYSAVYQPAADAQKSVFARRH